MLDSGPVRRDPRDPTSRWLAVAAGGLSIVLILLGVFGNRVLIDATGTTDLRCGLRACDMCRGDNCISMSTIALVDDIQAARGDASAAWGWAGTIAFWSALVAVLGLALAVGMVASRRFVRIPILSPTSLALAGGAIALIAGCVFVATKPEGVGVTRIGWTFWVFGVGVVASVASAFLLSNQLALLEPEFDPGESPEEPPVEPWGDV